MRNIIVLSLHSNKNFLIFSISSKPKCIIIGKLNFFETFAISIALSTEYLCQNGCNLIPIDFE